MVQSPEDLRPPGHEDGDELSPGEKLTIVIDSKKYRAPARIMSGAQLRRLADPDISSAFDLWQEVPGGEDNLVGDHERIMPVATATVLPPCRQGVPRRTPCLGSHR